MGARKIIKYGLAGIIGTALVVGNPNQAKAPSRNLEELFKGKIEKQVKKLELGYSVIKSKNYVDDFYENNLDVSFEKEYVLATIFAESRGDIFACSRKNAKCRRDFIWY